MSSRIRRQLTATDFLKALFEVLVWSGLFIQAVIRGKPRELRDYLRFRKETYAPDSIVDAKALISFMSWSFDQRRYR
ncbi:MAG: hypothetical protein HKL81_08285 [Acidimicrobiaceae bacterium]|nr:hypothetical protein [Acidimicrobiaceae bacterium]